ncbi:hypothetical protein CBL_09120 [Carabus blaptoides fortunei]
MSRQSARGRPHCSGSSAGSASYQGVSGATSPVYHLPQEPFHNTEFGNSYRKKSRDGPYGVDERDHHNYYNIHQKQQQVFCNKDSLADTHSYQYFSERDDRKSYGNVDNTFSEDSSYYEYQRNYERDAKQTAHDKRFINNVYSEYDSDYPIPHNINVNVPVKKNFQKQDLRYQSGRSNHHGLKENHLVVNQECLRAGLDRVYPETPLTRVIADEFRHESLPRRSAGTTRLSDRANSPGGTSVGSAIVDGCGGHCVAFENIFFVMGILIGVSLCIAGTVLRRTKSRDLQVLVYIGAMSAMVCTLLLIVQCRVRRSLRNRKRAVRLTRTATIPLNDIRPVQQPLINVRNEDRPVIVPAAVQQRPEILNEDGVPWWRRTDHAGNRI